MADFRPKFYYAKRTSHKPVSRRRRVVVENGHDQTILVSSDRLNRAQIRSGFNRGYQLAKVEQITERDSLKMLRHKRRQLARLLQVCLLIMGCLTVFLWFFIAKIEVDLAEDVAAPKAAYHQTIERYLQQHPFERMSFNLERRSLERFIQNYHPEVKQISRIQTGFWRSSYFELELRQPVATMIANNQRFFVDANGVSFQRDYPVHSLIEIRDQSGVRQATTDSQQQIVSGRFLGFIGQAIALGRERGVKIERVVIPSGTIHQVELGINGHSASVKMTLDRDVVEQVEDLSRALRYLKATGRTVQYLDVRVANKVFYK